MQETQEMLVQSLGQDDPLEEEMATRSSILAWKKYSCLENFMAKEAQQPSLESQRVRHN